MRASIEAINEAAEALLASLDVTLERLAERVQQNPPAGSVLWRSHWEDRQTEGGRALVRQHLLTKIAIAAAAHIDPVHDIMLARKAGASQAEITRATGKPARPRSRRSRIEATVEETGQLAMW